MLAFISRLVLKLAAVRWLFKLGGLGLLVPIALMLKAIGLPLLIVLMIVGFPVLLLLFLFGLPIFAVFALGGLLVSFLGFALSVGLAAIKLLLFVVLPAVVLWKITRAVWCRMSRRGGDGDAHGSPEAPDVPHASPIGATPDAE
jgi:hypothetical protein